MSRPLPWTIIGPVVATMGEVSQMQTLTTLRQIPLGDGEGRLLYPSLLASALVKRTHALGGAAKAVNELLELVASNTGYSRIVMVLAGVHVTAPAELAPGICLLPFDGIQPPSWIKDFEEKRLWPLSRSFDPVAPSAALVTRVVFSPVFASDKQVQGYFPEKEIEQLRIIANCITLSAGQPATVVMVWYEDDDPRFPLITSGITFNDPRWGSRAAARFDADPDKIRTVVARYKGFQGERRQIDLAIARLTDAWTGWHREERAIDLGVSLEAMLLYAPKSQPSENSEIGYKLSTRAAWLLGTALADRRAILQAVRKLYRYRSQAAHSGQVRTRPDTWRAVDIEIEAGITMASQIILAILTRGVWPDWDNLVLGE